MNEECKGQGFQWVTTSTHIATERGCELGSHTYFQGACGFYLGVAYVCDTVSDYSAPGVWVDATTSPYSYGLDLNCPLF